MEVNQGVVLDQAEGFVVGDKMHFVTLACQGFSKFSSDDTASTISRVTYNSDFHVKNNKISYF